MNPDWDETAYDALADAWVQATPDERDTIERAVHRVNRLLRDAPEHQGESRTGSIFVMIEAPLTVYFRYTPGTPTRVLHVRFFRRR